MRTTKTTRRALTAVAGLAIAAAAAGCGGATAATSHAPAAPGAAAPPATGLSFPSCSEVYAEGATAHMDSAGNWDPSCMDGGTVNVGITAGYDCPDGSKVSWTDRGWMHNGIVHVGKMDVDGDGQFTFADTAVACTR